MIPAQHRDIAAKGSKMQRLSDFLVTYGLYGLGGGMIGLFLAGVYGFLIDDGRPYIIAALIVFMSIASLIIGAVIEANLKAMEAERARDRWNRSR